MVIVFKLIKKSATCKHINKNQLFFGKNFASGGGKFCLFFFRQRCPAFAFDNLLGAGVMTTCLILGKNTFDKQFYMWLCAYR